MRGHLRATLLACVAAAVVAGGCAAKVPPPLPTAQNFPEFIFPAAPAGARAADTASLDLGWRYLQNDDLGAADREFRAVLKRAPRFYPAATGTAYVSLARRDFREAVSGFEAVLAESPAYVPALVGRGQALLGLERGTDAQSAFEAALKADPSLADVRRRLDVLRFRSLQDVLDAARTAAKAGRLDEARAAYRRALETSPDTAFLRRELAAVERRRGDATAALDQLRQAVKLDPGDAAALVELADLLEAQGDLPAAEQAYRSVLELEPSDAVRKRMDGIAVRLNDARLPEEYRAIEKAAQITRGDLAALIGIRLEDVVRTATAKQVVTTDTRGHWANQWIAPVARAGIIEPFANHTFQPRTRLRRVDLATAVSRVLMLLTASRPDDRTRWTKDPPAIGDVGGGHLDYPAVSLAVASGAMPLLDANQFVLARPVSGAEAIEVIERLRVLATSLR